MQKKQIEIELNKVWREFKKASFAHNHNTKSFQEEIKKNRQAIGSLVLMLKPFYPSIEYKDGLIKDKNNKEPENRNL